MNEEARASLATRGLKRLLGSDEQKKYWATLFGTLGAVAIAGGVSIVFALPTPRIGLGATGVVCGIILAEVGALALSNLKASKEAT